MVQTPLLCIPLVHRYLNLQQYSKLKHQQTLELLLRCPNGGRMENHMVKLKYDTDYRIICSFYYVSNHIIIPLV